MLEVGIALVLDSKSILGKGVNTGSEYDDVKRVAGAAGALLSRGGHVVSDTIVGTRRKPGFVSKGFQFAPGLLDVGAGAQAVIYVPERGTDKFSHLRVTEAIPRIEDGCFICGFHIIAKLNVILSRLVYPSR